MLFCSCFAQRRWPSKAGRRVGLMASRQPHRGMKAARYTHTHTQTQRACPRKRKTFKTLGWSSVPRPASSCLSAVRGHHLHRVSQHQTSNRIVCGRSNIDPKSHRRHLSSPLALLLIALSAETSFVDVVGAGGPSVCCRLSISCLVGHLHPCVGAISPSHSSLGHGRYAGAAGTHGVGKSRHRINPAQS